MRRPVIAGNWKMHLTLAEARALARAVRDGVRAEWDVELGVAPPFPYLAAVAQELAGSPVWVAGQDAHWERSGAHTGDVAAPMLREVGATHVILGHSERRHGHGEAPAVVGRKVRAVLTAGLRPILCVGETLVEREAGRTPAVVLGQLEAGLEAISGEEMATVLVAYEPVWAIGTGVHASPAQAGEVHGLVRDRLARRFSPAVAAAARILYGGSVKPDNAAALFAVDGVDGALVGGASLAADAFLGIVAHAARSSAGRR